MKFLTFTDLHINNEGLKALVERAKKEDINFIVCAGDISFAGNGVRQVFKSFNDIGKPFLFIPGNHEEGRSFIDTCVKDFSQCVNFHQKSVEINEYVFLGYGGGGFTFEDANFRKVAREWYGKFNGKKIVLVTHQPPLETKLDLLNERHVGNKDYADFIKRIKPKLAISGHLHETAGEVDKIAETKLVNPGWQGVVIELN